MGQPDRSVHYRACNLCEAICGLAIEVEDGRITSIRGDAEDPFSRGHICPKAVALQDIHDDPDRLRHPMLRRGSEWQRIGWDEAFDLAAERLQEVQQTHGHDAVATYLGNPNVHNYGSLLFGPPLLRALRTKNRYSATSVDQLPHHFNAHFMFGHQQLLPIPDLDRTDFLLILGGNPAVSNGSIMTAPDVKKRLKAIRQRGGQLVVIDPRRSETARLADEHHFIRPGTDVYLLAALLNTIYAEGLDDPGRLAEFTHGAELPRKAVARYTPESVAPVTGLDAGTIRQLARQLAAAPSAAVYGRMGVSVTEFGALAHWLINVLNFATGNLDRPGGMMFTRPAADTLPESSPGRFGRWHSRVRGLPEFGGELPVAALTEEILTPGEGQIRALITAAGNPVLSTPDGSKLERALGGLDFMLSLDIYINETTRHADLILPPTAALEHDNYDLAFHLLAVRNTARYSPALFEPAEDTRHDWQILDQLARRLTPKAGLVKDLKSATESKIRRQLGPAGMLDHLLRRGPYKLKLEDLQAAPHGLDFGPLESCLPGRLFTANKKIELAPDVVLGDLERLERRFAELVEPPAYVLIGRRQVRSNNSWMHNYPRLMRGKDRCTLLLHPDDATVLGVADGDRLSIRSRVGQITAPVEVSDEIMPGIVSLPHGWGHGRPGIGLTVASQHAGISINDLTDPEQLDQLSGNAALNGLPVELEVATPATQATPQPAEPAAV
nr:formate dehydrogenase H-like [Nerophis lumbriciformis]